MITCSTCGSQCHGMLKNPGASFDCVDCRERKTQREAKRGVMVIIGSAFVLALVLVILEKVFLT